MSTQTGSIDLSAGKAITTMVAAGFENAEGKYATKSEVEHTASSITSSVAATYTTKQEFEALEVGGRNYLKGSASMDRNEHGWYTDTHASVSDGVATLNGTTGDWNSKLGSSLVDVGLFDDDYVRVSFDYKASIDTLVYIDIDGCNVAPDQKNNNSRTKYRTSAQTFPATAEWTRFEWSVIPRVMADVTSGSGDVLSIYVGIWNRTNDSVLQIRRIKLEKGTIATDWTPAPEDIETRMTSAETVIEQTANNVLIKATKDDRTAAEGGQHLIQSLINVAPSGVKIAASKVEIDGTAVFNDSDFQSKLTETYSPTVAHRFDNAGRGAGYVKLCNITTTMNYHNRPVTFTINHRAQPACNVTWFFQNTNTPATAGVGGAYYDGVGDLYYVSLGSGSYDIYAKLAESYDQISITDFYNPYTDGGLTVTWSSDYYGPSAPENGVVFTRLIGQQSKASYDTAISSAQSTANAAAPKTQAVKRTQRIYYRTSAPKSSWTMPTAWLDTAVSATDVFNQWTRKVPRLTANADGTGDKYLYLYTCEQREMVDGTLAYTTVLLDDSTTIIDGGNIITGSVTANQIAAEAITAGKIDANAISVGGVANLEQTLDDNLAAALSAVDALSESTDAEFAEVVTTIEALSEEFEERTEGVRKDGTTHKFGQGDNGMRIEVGDDAVTFMSDADTLAAVGESGFSANTVTANEQHFTNETAGSDWMWIARENGNLTLKWVGGDD